MTARKPRGAGKSPAKIPGESPAAGFGSPGESHDGEEARESLFDVSGDSTIRVERLDEHTGRWVFHGYMTDVTEAAISERFGGGRYKCKLLETDERGSRVIRKTREFTLPGPYRAPTDLPGVRPTVPAPVEQAAAAGAAHQAPERVSVNEMLNSALVTQLLDIMKVKSQPVQPSGPPPWLEAIAPVLPVLVERLLARQPGLSPELVAMMEEFRSMRAELSALRQQGPVSGAMGDAIKAIRELMEVRDMIVPGGEGGGGVDAAMLGLGTKLLEKMGSAPAESPTVRPPTSGPPVPSSMPLWQQLLMRYRVQLVEAAMRGMDPGAVADLAAQFLPAELEGVAVEYVQRPDAATVASQVIPQLQEFPKWNADFWDALRSLLLDKEGEADDAEA